MPSRHARAEGLSDHPAKGTALGLGAKPFPFQTAQRAKRSYSIPRIALINLDFVLLTDQAEFLLERPRTMVLRLTFDIIDHLRHRRLADRECAVTGLPMKIR